MARRRYLSTGQQVRELVSILGSKKAVVREMGAASKSSLKRWMRRECQPIRAHVNDVSNLYSRKRELLALVKILRKEAEMKVRMEMLAQNAKKNRRK